MPPPEQVPDPLGPPPTKPPNPLDPKWVANPPLGNESNLGLARGGVLDNGWGILVDPDGGVIIRFPDGSGLASGKGGGMTRLPPGSIPDPSVMDPRTWARQPGRKQHNFPAPPSAQEFQEREACLRAAEQAYLRGEITGKQLVEHSKAVMDAPAGQSCPPVPGKQCEAPPERVSPEEISRIRNEPAPPGERVGIDEIRRIRGEMGGDKPPRLPDAKHVTRPPDPEPGPNAGGWANEPSAKGWTGFDWKSCMQRAEDAFARGEISEDEYLTTMAAIKQEMRRPGGPRIACPAPAEPAPPEPTRPPREVKPSGLMATPPPFTDEEIERIIREEINSENVSSRAPGKIGRPRGPNYKPRRRGETFNPFRPFLPPPKQCCEPAGLPSLRTHPGASLEQALAPKKGFTPPGRFQKAAARLGPLLGRVAGDLLRTFGPPVQGLLLLGQYLKADCVITTSETLRTLLHTVLPKLNAVRELALQKYGELASKVDPSSPCACEQREALRGLLNLIREIDEAIKVAAALALFLMNDKLCDGDHRDEIGLALAIAEEFFPIKRKVIRTSPGGGRETLAGPLKDNERVREARDGKFDPDAFWRKVRDAAKRVASACPPRPKVAAPGEDEDPTPQEDCNCPCPCEDTIHREYQWAMPERTDDYQTLWADSFVINCGVLNTCRRSNVTTAPDGMGGTGAAAWEMWHDCRGWWSIRATTVEGYGAEYRCADADFKGCGTAGTEQTAQTTSRFVRVHSIAPDFLAGEWPDSITVVWVW